MRLRPFDYVAAGTVAETVEALATHGMDAQLIAGGTVVVPMMKHRLLAPSVLIGIDRIPELRGVTTTRDGIRIGAATTHRELADDAAVRAQSPLLATACRSVASPVIRSMGTLGGNVCYGESASDPPSALLALGAHAVLHGPQGRRTVPLSDFFLGLYETDVREGELLTEVVVPAQPADARSIYVKWTPRAKEDKPLLGLAVLLTVDGDVCREAQLAVSGIDPVPTLLPAAVNRLAGSRLTATAIDEAAEAASAEVDPIDDLQGTATYRRDMLRVWVGRALRNLTGELRR